MFALKTFKEQLGLESEASLEGNVEIREIPEGYEILNANYFLDNLLLYNKKYVDDLSSHCIYRIE